MTNYWIFKVQEEVGGLYRRTGMDIFIHRIKECFWGIREYDKSGKLNSKVALPKEGDFVLFYLVGKEEGGSFVGTAVLDSGYVRLDDEQAKRVVHGEFVDCDQGFLLRQTEKWAKPLPVENLRGKGGFTSTGNFGSFFQGNIKRIKRSQDYETIVEEHELMR